MSIKTFQQERTHESRPGIRAVIWSGRNEKTETAPCHNRREYRLVRHTGPDQTGPNEVSYAYEFCDYQDAMGDKTWEPRYIDPPLLSMLVNWIETGLV